MRLHRLTEPGRQVAILTPWLERRRILPARVSRQTALIEALGLGGRASSAVIPSVVATRSISANRPPTAYSPVAATTSAATPDSARGARRFLAPIRSPDQHSRADEVPLALA